MLQLVHILSAGSCKDQEENSFCLNQKLQKNPYGIVYLHVLVFDERCHFILFGGIFRPSDFKEVTGILN